MMMSTQRMVTPGGAMTATRGTTRTRTVCKAARDEKMPRFSTRTRGKSWMATTTKGDARSRASVRTRKYVCARVRLSAGDAETSEDVEGARATRETTRRWGKPAAACALVIGACALTAMVMPESALAAKSAAVAKAAASNESMLTKVLGFVMHLDKHLAELFASQGKMAYGILFAIIFAETGFVVTPFLPGDSLLFATGALGALGVVNFPLTVGLLFAAAVLGDTVNYSIGSYVGKSFMETHPKLFPPEYIEKTKNFYEKYGGKTVVLARFFVIVRTFAPFVAGVANMNYAKFITYNFVGAAIWILSFMGIGFFFGAMPAVQENFALAVAGIIVLSLVPVFIEVVQHMRGGGSGDDKVAPA